jgi:hypothetical protein
LFDSRLTIASSKPLKVSSKSGRFSRIRPPPDAAASAASGT